MPNQYDPRLSEDTVQGILRDRDTGMTLHAIASKWKCSVSMVWKVANGVTRRQPDRDTGAGMTAEELDAMVAANYPTMNDRIIRTPAAKLSAEQVVEIRRLRTDGRIYADIASRFGVSISAVWRIATKKTWSHVLRAAG